VSGDEPKVYARPKKPRWLVVQTNETKTTTETDGHNKNHVKPEPFANSISVWRWLLDVVDDQLLYGRFPSVEFEAELFLQRGEKTGPIVSIGE
jgi:hypothetical protein